LHTRSIFARSRSRPRANSSRRTSLAFAVGRFTMSVKPIPFSNARSSSQPEARGRSRCETLHIERVPPRRAQAGLPDVIPLADPQTGFCKRDDQGNLIVTVKNQGSADGGASTTTVVFVSGGTFSQPTPPIPAGGSVDLSFPIPATCFTPDCEFRIIVDSGNQVTESDEGNNIASGTCRG
jgi:hypothetical protein